MELIIGALTFFFVVFALWTVACITLKVMFKIADKIFRP